VPEGGGFLPVALLAGAMLVIMAVFLALYAARYTRVRPNEALIVYGRRQPGILPGGKRGIVGYRIVLGGGTFVFPVFERAERVSLEAFSVRAEADGLEASGHLRVKGDGASVAAAAERFLSKDPGEVAAILGDILRRHLRTAEGDREEWVRRKASEELAPMGYEIVSLSVREKGA
jgi:flotillin